MENKKYEEFNDARLARIYDLFNWLHQDEVFWLDQIAKISPKRVIDFGCWTGLLTCKIAEKWYSVVWIDPAKSMLDLAINKPFIDKVVWIIWSTEVLTTLWEVDVIVMTSHVAQFFVGDSEWKKLLVEAYSCLSKWGYILFDSKNPNLAPWKSWIKEKSLHQKQADNENIEMWTELLELWEKTTKHKHHYTFERSWETLTASTTLIYRSKDEIVRDLEDIGFIIENIYWNFYWKKYNENTSKEMIFLARKA